MFSFFKSKKINILSPFDGELVNIEDVPDEVFSQKLIGDGIAIIPKSSTLLSPIDGKIIRFFDTYHAFTISSPSGIEVLIHIGLDTVELQGEGFTPLKKEGDEVEIGTPILKVDFDYLKEKKKEIITPIIITSSKNIKLIKEKIGNIKEQESIIEVKI